MDRHGDGIEIQTLFREPVALLDRAGSSFRQNSGAGQSAEPIGQDISGDPRRGAEVIESADAEEGADEDLDAPVVAEDRKALGKWMA